MKKIFLCTIPLFIGVIFAGCSKNENNGTSSDEKQVIVVKLPGAPGTRVVETPEVATAVTETLDEVTVFLLSDQIVYQTETFTAEERTSKAKRIEQVSANINRVIVVANTNGTDLSGVNNANEILNYAFSIASQYGENKSGLEGRTLMGEGVPADKADPYPGPGVNPNIPDHGSLNHKYKEVTINLEAITSRIEVGDVKAGVGIEEIELLAVYINNYYTTHAKTAISRMVETWNGWPTIPNSPSASALDPSTTIVPSSYTEARYVDLHNDQVKLSDDTKAYAYHVFSGNLPHVILLVKGKYTEEYTPLDEDNSNAPMPYFIGWVTFTKYKKDGSYIPKMLPNNIYKMGVDRNGIVIDAPNIQDRPEKENFDLGIDVRITPWTINVVTPEV